MIITLLEADTGRILSPVVAINHRIYDLRANWPRGTVRAREILTGDQLAEIATANPGFHPETLVHPAFSKRRRRRRQSLPERLRQSETRSRGQP